MHQLSQKLSLVLLSLLSLSVFAQDQTKHVEFGAQALKINDKPILALTFHNEDKWHTYWKNPGDAGTEIKVAFRVNSQEAELNDYPWPKPKRYIEQGNLWAYGYGHKYALFYDLPLGLKNKTLEIKAEWLVCKDICIPGGEIISLNLDDNLTGAHQPKLEEAAIKKIFEELPKDSPGAFSFYLNKTSEENKLSLNYVIENADFSQVSNNESIVYPYLQFPFDYKHEEIYFDRENKMIFIFFNRCGW